MLEVKSVIISYYLPCVLVVIGEPSKPKNLPAPYEGEDNIACCGKAEFQFELSDGNKLGNACG